jgi:uncharacterized protein YndB with AHSA1/START domain/uncharacterized protein YciI
VSPIPPIRREVLVDAGPKTAFEVFTGRIGAWWPVAGHSVHGAGSAVSFDGGRLLERSPAGEECVWGTVTRWEPPHALAFSWHPGAAPETATRVTVTFAAAGRQTLVTLEHSGWEALADPAAARASYDQGWPEVLAGLREHASRDGADGAPGAGAEQAGGPPDGAATRVALVHRPGPAAPADHAAVFGDPRFRLHVGFLNLMRDRGWLVAAGPLPREPGSGMTILRLPGPGRAAEAAAMAARDDPSVVGGLFTVTVTPWDVLLEA